MAASPLCMVVVLPEVEGCLAGVNLHHPPVQVHVCVLTEKQVNYHLFFKKMLSNSIHSQWNCRQSAVHTSLWKVAQSISHQSSQPEKTAGNGMIISHIKS